MINQNIVKNVAMQQTQTSAFMDLSHDEQWERVHHHILSEGATEYGHWMHREIQLLRTRCAELQERPGDIHVMPTCGHTHRESAGCWCRPRADPVTLDRAKYANTVWIHEVSQ